MTAAANRLSSGLFGHEKVYFIIGVNKIAPGSRGCHLEGPEHRRAQKCPPLRKKDPCAVKADRCYDCKSPERICAAMVIYWEKPALIPEAEVVIIGQELGF